MRDTLGYRVLPYIDEFLAAPCRYERPSTQADCRRARKRLSVLFGRLGIMRHEEKGCWEGGRRVEHLGKLIDMEDMKVYVSDAKVKKVQGLARKILLMA